MIVKMIRQLKILSKKVKAKKVSEWIVERPVLRTIQWVRGWGARAPFSTVQMLFSAVL